MTTNAVTTAPANNPLSFHTNLRIDWLQMTLAVPTNKKHPPNEDLLLMKQ